MTDRPEEQEPFHIEIKPKDSWYTYDIEMRGLEIWTFKDKTYLSIGNGGRVPIQIEVNVADIKRIVIELNKYVEELEKEVV